MNYTIYSIRFILYLSFLEICVRLSIIMLLRIIKKLFCPYLFKHNIYKRCCNNQHNPSKQSAKRAENHDCSFFIYFTKGCFMHDLRIKINIDSNSAELLVTQKEFDKLGNIINKTSSVIAPFLTWMRYNYLHV